MSVAAARRSRLLLWVGVVMLLCPACGFATADPAAEGDAAGPSAEATPGTDQSAPRPAAASSEVSDAEEHPIQIQIFQFSQDLIDVAAGDTVRWTNTDEIIHTVTSGSRTYGDLGVVTATETDGLFDFTLDGRVPAQASGAFTFEEAGTYTMICTIHPGIDMTVEVAA